VSIFIMHLLKEYGISYGYFRLFEYLTFRTMLAAITALLFVMIFGHPVTSPSTGGARPSTLRT